MLERRQYERFTLTLPCTVEMLGSDSREQINAQTRDISAGGAYFQTWQPFQEGLAVKLRLHVTSEKLKLLTGAQVLVKVDGTVLRSDSKGMAVSFNGDYELVRLRVSLS